MKQFFVFSFVGGVALYRSATADEMLPMVILANVAVGFIGGALAFGFQKPEMFMKLHNGRLSFFSYLVFWSYILSGNLLVMIYRLLSREHPIDEILPGVYLGCKLCHFDKGKLSQRGICAVLDATSELGEAGFIRKHYNYLCIPVLDNHPPTLEQLSKAVTWIEEQLLHGGIFIHCALGHGRSATIVVAYLLHTRTVSGIQEAIAFIKSKRPGIHLLQRQLSRVSEIE